jgi:hypothetical protein
MTILPLSKVTKISIICLGLTLHGELLQTTGLLPFASEIKNCTLAGRSPLSTHLLGLFNARHEANSKQAITTKRTIFELQFKIQYFLRKAYVRLT